MSNNRPLNLASAYCQIILNRHINIKVDLWLIKQAGALVKALDSIGADEQDAILLLVSLEQGKSELTGYVRWSEWAHKRGLTAPVSMNNLLYVRPDGRSDANLLQAALEIKEQPSVQDAAGYAEWVRTYGPRALRSGKWDGIYRYHPFTPPESQAIPPGELRTIVGEQLAQCALDTVRAVEVSLNANIQSRSRKGVGCRAVA